MKRFVFLLMLAAATPAFADGKVLLTCHIEGGGNVTVEATSSSKAVNLVFDESATSLTGVPREDNLPAILESNDPGSTGGPIDLLEIGTFHSDGHACGLGLEFNVNNQRLGRDRDVALKPDFTYNTIECKGKKERIESCSLGADLMNVSALKNFIQIEVAD